MKKFYIKNLLENIIFLRFRRFFQWDFLSFFQFSLLLQKLFPFRLPVSRVLLHDCQGIPFVHPPVSQLRTFRSFLVFPLQISAVWCPFFEISNCLRLRKPCKSANSRISLPKTMRTSNFCRFKEVKIVRKFMLRSFFRDFIEFYWENAEFFTKLA